jgi:hypothetical protein
MNPFFNTFTYRIIYIMLLGIIFITITLHKRTQSIQKTSVKEIQQFSNEKVESDAEVAVHGGFVEDAGLALVQLEDGLIPEAVASEDCGAVVNMGVKDHHEARVVLPSSPSPWRERA